jgi:hypothetical protein
VTMPLRLRLRVRLARWHPSRRSAFAFCFFLSCVGIVWVFVLYETSMYVCLPCLSLCGSVGVSDPYSK